MRKKTLNKIEATELANERLKNAFHKHSAAKKMKESDKKTEIERSLVVYMPSDFLCKKVRDPNEFKTTFKTSDIDKRFLYFAKHLFCKYKTPKFFDKLLNTKEIKSEKSKEFIKWFICLGVGGSLYKEYTKSFLTKKETHILSNCPHDELKVQQAIVYAIAFAESNNIGISKRIACSKLADKDLKAEFWRNCVKFFSNQERVPESIDKVNDLVDYLAHEKTQDVDFNIFGSGFTLESLKKRMIDWHHELRRAKEFGVFTWEGHDIEDFDFYRNEGKENQEKFEIKQIKNSKELLAEGKSQHHCVFSYKKSCMSGSCSIWSFTLNDKRKVTIEVVNKRIVQARGYANRQTRAEEDFIINKWCSKTGVKYSKLW